jgi:hypothetical protein
MAALNHHAPGRDRRERRAKLLRSNKVGQAAPPAHPASRPSFSGSGGQLTAPAATARERRQVITQQQGGTGGAACPSGIATQLRTGPRPQGSGGKLLRSNKVGQAVPPAHPASRPSFSGSGGQLTTHRAATARERRQVITQQQGGAGGAAGPSGIATQLLRERRPTHHAGRDRKGAEASYYAATRWDRRRRLPIRHRDPASQGAEANSPRTGARPQGSGGKLLRSNKVGQAVPPAHPASRPPSQEAAAATAPGRDRKGAEASYYAATRWGRRRHLPIRHRDPVSQGAEANSPRTEPRPQGSGGPSYYAATRWDRRRRLPIRHRDPASQGAEAKSLGTSPQS